jgi:hypothetical protein
MLDSIENEITNEILFYNRKILKCKYERNELTASRSELIELGFDFSYHTNKLKQQDSGQEFIFVYDFGIGETKEGYWEIIRLPGL